MHKLPKDPSLGVKTCSAPRVWGFVDWLTARPTVEVPRQISDSSTTQQTQWWPDGSKLNIS